MNRLYNEEIKERFLSQYDNEQTQKTIRNVFFKTFIVENTLDKDLFEQNLTEIGKAIENTNPQTKNVASSNGRFISNYISWAIENGYRESNLNPLRGIDNDWYNKFIDKSMKIHYSYDEFIDLLEDKDMLNGQDQAFLFLLFEGIIGEKFSQITELKFSDINWIKKTVYVKERNLNIEVSDDCIKYLEKAYNQNTYYQYNPNNKDFTEKELLPSEYIFKNIKSPRGTENEPLKINVIYKRIQSLKEIFDLEYLTPNAIKQSGMIWETVKQYKKDGVIGYDQLAAVGEKYDYSTITSAEGYQYFNTYLMKEFISEENIKNLYGIDLEIKLR
jgi:integrase